MNVMTTRIIRSREAALSPEPGLSPAMEDYLRAIYLTHQQDISVTPQVLAAQLAVTPPSVINMMKRLAQRGLVQHAPHRPITLTVSGETIAADLVERYWLLVEFLIMALGFPDDAVDREASRLEHAVSGHLRSCIAECVTGAKTLVTNNGTSA